MNRTEKLWHDSAYALINNMYKSGTERLMAMTLLDATRDVKRGKEPEAGESWEWFDNPFQEGLSLSMVCDTLNLYVGDVRRRVRKMTAIAAKEEQYAQ